MVNEVESIDLSLSITLDKLNLMMEKNELIQVFILLNF